MRREIILTLSSVLISLIIGELMIRVLDPLGISYYQGSSEYHLDKLPDPILIYKHAPALDRTYQGTRVLINDLGQRDRKLEKKQDGELRILLLGDSVTFGWGVPAEVTFGRKLESMLASQPGRVVRTVNTGVGSYNTVQEYAVLRAYAEVIEPDVVVLLYVNNDIKPHYPPFDPWSKLSLVGKSPPQAIKILLWKSWLYRLGQFALRFSPLNSPASLDTNESGVAESMDALASIATFCRKRDLGFVTFFYRSKGVELEGLSSSLLSKIQSIGQTHGFPVADVGLWWAGFDRRSVINSIVDTHPNEQGHGILAAGMADFLTKHGLANSTSVAAR